MTRCHICDAIAMDAHEPLLCGSCCEDRVARIVADLAHLDVTEGADLAARIGVPFPVLLGVCQRAVDASGVTS